MNKRTSLLAAGIVGLLLTLAGTAWAQDGGQPAGPPGSSGQPNVNPAKPDLDAPIPAEELDRRRQQIQQGLSMAPQMLGQALNLTDAQKQSVSQIATDRWNSIPKEDQDKMLRVMTLGEQLARSGQATPEDWQKLMKDVVPVMESMTKIIIDATGDIDKVLDDNQKAKFAEMTTGIKAKMEEGLAQLKGVADGTVKMGPNGVPLGGGRGGDVQLVEEDGEVTGPDGVTRKIKIKRIKSNLPDEETVAGDEKYWMPYLKGYMLKYDLDGEQQKSALRLLGAAVSRARQVRQQSKQAFDDARQKIKDAQATAAENPTALQAAHLAYDQLNRPVVDIFQAMRKQLDNLLTDPQREAGKTRGDVFGAKGQAQSIPPNDQVSQPPADQPGAAGNPNDPSKNQLKNEPRNQDVKIHVIR